MSTDTTRITTRDIEVSRAFPAAKKSRSPHRHRSSLPRPLAVPIPSSSQARPDSSVSKAVMRTPSATNHPPGSNTLRTGQACGVLFSEGLDRAAVHPNAALPTAGLVDLTSGNVSVCDREAGAFAIKPSGVPYERLTPADMVIVDMDGEILEGALRPSSDTPTQPITPPPFRAVKVKS
jgi:hypothetical protein